MTTIPTFDIKTAKVAVLMGGRSAEREISLMSGEGVLKALQGKGVHALAFDPANQDRKSTRLNSSHSQQSRMPSSA